MPSTSRPSPCSGCARRTLSKRRTSTSSDASRNSTRGRMPALGEVANDAAQVGGERPAAHVHDDGEAGDRALAAAAEIDQRRHEFGRQVVDDEVAEILQALAPPSTAPAPDSPVTITVSSAPVASSVDALTPGACRRRRTSPVVTFTAGAGRFDRAPDAVASAATIDSAVCRPIPGTRDQVVDGGGPQPLHRAEVGQQGLAPGRPEACDAVQGRGRHRLGPLLAVEGDGEPVRLVAHPLQQVQPLGGARQDRRVLLAGQPDLLQPLGQPDERDVVDAELVEDRLRRRDLRRAAVDHQQVRRVGELARPAGRRVDPGRSARPPPPPGRHRRRRPPPPARRGSGRTGGARPRRSSPCRRCRSRMANRRYSLLRASPSSKTTMLATTFVPCTWLMSKHSMRSGAVGRLERLLQLGQRPRAGGEVGGPLELVLRQRLRGVAGDRLQQRPLVAALRHPQLRPVCPAAR